jgi:hypothetical protein
MSSDAGYGQIRLRRTTTRRPERLDANYWQGGQIRSFAQVPSTNGPVRDRSREMRLLHFGAAPSGLDT